MKKINYIKNNKIRIIIYFFFILFLSLYNYKRIGMNTKLFFLIELLLAFIFLIVIFKCKNLKIEKVFLLLGIPLGLAYMFSVPFCKIPDESPHFSRAYSISKGELISKTNDKDLAYVELPFSIYKIYDANNYDEYKKVINNKEKKEAIFTNTALYNFLVYFPQTLGILVSRLLNLSPIFMIYIARLFNLICYLSLIYFAIKLIPKFKEIILLVALNPMALQEGASISADSLTISISIFLISYVFYLGYTKKDELLTKREFIILFITTIICSLCKIVYVPLCLLSILLPKTKFKNNKDRIIKVSIVIILSIMVNLVWLKIASKYLIVYNPGVDSGNQVKYVLTHPFNYLIIILRTLKKFFITYISTMFGASLNVYNVNPGSLYSYSTLLLLFIVSIIERFKGFTIKIKDKLVLIFLFVSIILLIFTSLYVQWTPLKYPFIEGVQGRYFLPIVLLIPFILLRSKSKESRIKIDTEFIYKLLLVFLVFQNLNAIISIIITYM